MNGNKTSIGTTVRKWCRNIHREASFFFAGMVIIYAMSGIFMNHRNSINPQFIIEHHEYTADAVPLSSQPTKEEVLKLIEPIGEAKNYTTHRLSGGNLTVYLKGGSNWSMDTTSRNVVYDHVAPRPVINSFVKLHYNPGRWWTYFADLFAIGLIVITITGLIMIKGNQGLWGRGGIELIVGILIPILFFLL